MRAALAFVLFAAASAAQTVPAHQPLVQPAREPLIGTVVDPDGRPVAGAMVELWRADGKDMAGLDLDYSHEYRLLAKVPTSKRPRVTRP